MRKSLGIRFRPNRLTDALGFTGPGMDWLLALGLYMAPTSAILWLISFLLVPPMQALPLFLIVSLALAVVPSSLLLRSFSGKPIFPRLTHSSRKSRQELKSKAKGKEGAGSLQDFEGGGITVEPITEKWEPLQEYWVRKPFAKITLARYKGEEATGSLKYFVEEARVSREEQLVYKKVFDILSAELNPREIGDEKVIRKAIIEGSQRIIRKYKKAFGVMEDETLNRILYKLERDMMGFGPIQPVMDDDNVEDISCDGIGSPIFVWHRQLESIPTNVTFLVKEQLDDFIVKLAHKSGKHVSSAFPIVDAMLYGRHRLAASFRDEVSPKGSTFTIRKFREEPLSIVDIVKLGTVSNVIAAYFWVLLENKATVMVLGGTGGGKTTILNALATLVKPGMKIVTVEETGELSIPHENWVQLISRESYGLTGEQVGQISLFDLVRMSLRYRPDYLVVGEIRGQEAFVLFQALATGHGGLSTMHAENLDYAIKRLTSPPMNISESYIPLMNIVILIERVSLPKEREGIGFGRRVRNMWEVVDITRHVELAKWDPLKDVHMLHLEQSYLLTKLASRTGKTKAGLLEEVEKRRKVIQWMINNDIRSVKDVGRIIASYYTDPEGLMRRMAEKAVVTAEIIDTKGKEESTSSVIQAEVLEVQQGMGHLTEDERKAIATILEIVMGEGGTLDAEAAMPLTRLDPISFWNGVDHLKRVGCLIVGTRVEGGGIRTYMVSTERGSRLYSALKPK